MGRNLWFTEVKRTPFAGEDSAASHPILELQLRNITRAHLEQACGRVSGWKLTAGKSAVRKPGMMVQIRAEASSCSDEEISQIMEDLKIILKIMTADPYSFKEEAERRHGSQRDLSRRRERDYIPHYVNDPNRRR